MLICCLLISADRRYDAFLSYRSNSDADRKFVVFQLLPYLEQEGYTVCIDQRDFIPGAGIVDSSLLYNRLLYSNTMLLRT